MLCVRQSSRHTCKGICSSVRLTWDGRCPAGDAEHEKGDNELIRVSAQEQNKMRAATPDATSKLKQQGSRDRRTCSGQGREDSFWQGGSLVRPSPPWPLPDLPALPCFSHGLHGLADLPWSLLRAEYVDLSGLSDVAWSGGSQISFDAGQCHLYASCKPTLHIYKVLTSV